MISAQLLAHSCRLPPNNTYKQLATFLLIYPRYIHGQLMTHRVFSRNSCSSRFIPTIELAKTVEQEEDTIVNWIFDSKALAPSEAIINATQSDISNLWAAHKHWSIKTARKLAKLGLHRQYANRILEPWMYQRTLVTSTEWDNFFKLRIEEHAQPEIYELATKMRDELESSNPVVLAPGAWHTPFATEGETTLERRIITSVARCARISSNNPNIEGNLQRNTQLYDHLLTNGHLSPFEHIASPMIWTNARDYEKEHTSTHDWEIGVTHMDRNYDLWSGNFKGWIQYRQTVKIPTQLP